MQSGANPASCPLSTGIGQYLLKSQNSGTQRGF
jgi:hypothetical protein